MPPAERRGSVPFTEAKPDLLWTLVDAADPEKTPGLPIVPAHMKNAYLEDHIHDWIVRGGVLYYYSRVVDLKRNGNWLLLEYKT
jgi:hypothetical protein